MVLSYHAHHPETCQTTLNGGRLNSANQLFQRPFPNLNHSLITRPTQMQALDLELQSPWAQDGEHGGLQRDGRPKDRTSSEPRQLASNFLSSAYTQYLKKGSTSRFTETIRESLRDGGKDPVATSQPTRFSSVSSSYLKTAVGQFTQDMSQVNKTLQMPPRGATTLLQTFYSQPPNATGAQAFSHQHTPITTWQETQ